MPAPLRLSPPTSLGTLTILDDMVDMSRARVVFFVGLAGLTVAVAVQTKAQAVPPPLRILVHTGDVQARGMLAPASEQATKARAERLGYDVFTGEGVTVFVPKPAWSSDLGAMLLNFLELPEPGRRSDSEIDAARLDVATRRHFERFLRTTGVGGQLGADMQAARLTRVSTSWDTVLELRQGSKVVRLPVAAPTLAAALRGEKVAVLNPTDPQELLSEIRRDAAETAPEKQQTDGDKEDESTERESPVARPELYGLMTEAFAVSTSRRLTPEEFERYVDFVKERLRQRRLDQEKALLDRIAKGFDALFEHPQAQTITGATGTAFETLPPELQDLLLQNSSFLARELGLDIRALGTAGLRDALAGVTVSLAPGDRRVFIGFELTPVNTPDGPVGRWVGFTADDVFGSSP